MATFNVRQFIPWKSWNLFVWNLSLIFIYTNTPRLLLLRNIVTINSTMVVVDTYNRRLLLRHIVDKREMLVSIV